ncbi:hypothetical protein EDB82DRAFT_546150 [Fusarium venenatum]|uniref:uncharacterized protein n=1 Tax=Fusarium venenatum TaxID=56646 RepID=UPI001D7CDA38|nr:hypothetical protein EDB82DRAFT_546150 [Fusarium venenatum]
MSSRPLSPVLGLSVRFDREVENVLAKNPTQSAKQVFFEVWQILMPEYEAMQQALNQYLSWQLEESSIRATLNSRVKKDDSICKSIERREEFRGKEYDSPGLIRNGIHDLIGFRIIVDYPSGLDQSYQLIKKRFSVEGINTFSSDRDVGVLWKPRFGAYEGRNFQVRMRPDEYNTGLSLYYGVLFEIQVTSIAESLYNKLAHPLQYKESAGTLSRQDEMIIDMSHGLSLCYWITIACMEERLETNSKTTHENSPLPDPIRIIAGHDPEENPDDLDDLVRATPDMPIISGDRSLRGSKAGSSTLKRTAPSEDTVSIELLLRSLTDLPREYRSDTDIWNGIRDKLGKNSIQKRHHNTFEWVFGEEKAQESYYGAVEVPTLASWLEEDIHCLYWVSGKPGSGKSFFMKFIEKDERTKAMLQRWKPQCCIISHYLWKLGSNDQSSFKGLVCSLFHQVLQNEKAIALRLLRESPSFCHKNDATDWDIEDVKRLLFDVLRRSDHPCLFLIDGLDEMSKPHDGMNQVFSFLDGLAKLDRVKVCVSSRPESLFATRFKSQPSLRMQDLTRKDILNYTVDKLGQLHIEVDDEKFQKATYEIFTRAEGVFIWVYMVLKDIQQDVDELDEGWDDILDRISKLPSDLMGLYRDMLSRFALYGERYVKRAALYFQYIQQRPGSMNSDIAMLSIAADEAALESFAGPNDTPCVDEWVKLCINTEKTLFRISAGLLEVKTERNHLPHASLSECDSKMAPWITKQVDFIHKTAIDFLEGEEGHRLFGTYAKTPKCMLMIYVKVKLAQHSIMRHNCDPLWHILEILPEESDDSYPIRVSHDIQSFIHACSIDKSKDLIRPPYSVSYENFFIFYLAYHQRYDWAQELINSCGTYNLEASAYVMLGACESCPCLPHNDNFRRYRVILDMLKNQSRVYENSVEDSSTKQGATDAILWAWRSFLLTELDPNNRLIFEVDRVGLGIHEDFVTHKHLVKEIVGLFMTLGVMSKVPGPKYIVASGPDCQGFKLVRDRVHRESHFGYKSSTSQFAFLMKPTYHIEVNDAWLLQQLLDGMFITQDIANMVKEHAFMRILLADKETDSFLIRKNDGTQEATVGYPEDLGPIGVLPDGKFRPLEETILGSCEYIIPVLDRIDYDLQDVNKTHTCLYELT